MTYSKDLKINPLDKDFKFNFDLLQELSTNFEQLDSIARDYIIVRAQDAFKLAPGYPGTVEGILEKYNLKSKSGKFHRTYLHEHLKKVLGKEAVKKIEKAVNTVLNEHKFIVIEQVAKLIYEEMIKQAGLKELRID